MDATDLKDRLEQELKGLSSLFVDADYANAATNAGEETGWTLPVTDNFQVHWFKERAKRWLFFFLYTESAAKFKVKQLSLDQKFKHFGELIKIMDKAFSLAVEDNPEKFSNVEAYKVFGHQIPPGFKYDATGKDITYK